MTSQDALTLVVRIAGFLHFTQIPAMFAAGRMLRWDSELGRLSPINRRIVRVIGLAIVIVMCGLGAVVVVAAEDIARGDAVLATGVSGFLACFLGFRTFVQWVVYARVWPADRWGRLSHISLGLLFSFQTLVYASACAHAALWTVG